MVSLYEQVILGFSISPSATIIRAREALEMDMTGLSSMRLCTWFFNPLCQVEWIRLSRLVYLEVKQPLFLLSL